MSVHSRSYVNAIDGLRALAVLSVLLFHLDASYLPGGFVGVDVFFAISGYVVCMAALSRPAESFWAFCTAFYARRVRRIVPALLVVLLTTSVLSALLVPEAWLSQANKRTGVAAFFGISNVVLGSYSGDYFSPRAEYNPFTHTWSLAIEEQFYLLCAPLMFLAGLAQSSAQRRVGLGLLLLLAMISLAVCVDWSLRWPVWAFYGSPARFWEMLVGVIACLAWPRVSGFVASWRAGYVQAASVCLMAALLAGLVAADARQFPWPWALWPVVSTALLMLLLSSRNDLWVSAALASPIARWIGQRSYALYLWHWPVYVLMRWTCGLESVAQQVLALILSFVLAFACHRWVEEPVRRGNAWRSLSDLRTIGFGTTATVCVAVMAGALFKAQEHISLSVTRDKAVWLPDAVPFVPEAERVCALRSSTQVLAGGEIERMTPVDCSVQAPVRQVFVLGDSHAGAYHAMLAEMVQKSGRSVQILRMSGCPVFNLKEPNASHEPSCAAFAVAALSHVQASALAGDILFLPSLRLHRLVDLWTTPEGRLEDALSRESASNRRMAVHEAVSELGALADVGVRIILEAPKPLAASPAIRCSDWFNRLNPVCRWGNTVPRQGIERYRAQAFTAVREVAAALPGASVWDPLPWLCEAGTCGSFKAGQPVIFDGDHLTGHANHVLVRPFMNALASAEGQ